MIVKKKHQSINQKHDKAKKTTEKKKTRKP